MIPGAGRTSSPPARRLLCGWGRTAPSAAHVVRPRTAEELSEVLAGAGRRGGVVARGLGRAYGDAAQCAGGTVVDTTALDGLHRWDAVTGTLRVGAGASLDTLMRQFVPRGWFVPVSPGTRWVTVGGAVAADIHGKNHHRDGSFCSHVTRLSLASPTGVHELGPEDADPGPFWATAGGMGMTGVVADATVRLAPIETATMRVDTRRAGDLDALMSALAESDGAYRYTVAWVDAMATGRRLGRGVLTSADHARLDELPPGRRHRPLAFAPRARLGVPVDAPPWSLNPVTVAAFNELWYRKAPRARLGELQDMATFFHPLDGIGAWNRLYGRRGFVQYQFAVAGAGADVVRAVLERLASARAASFLAVLKRFGPADPGPLSFPLAGWTLALDLPGATPSLGSLLDELDEMVVGAGGRVYLAKDARVRPELVAAMYPEIERWREWCRRLDPEGVLRSDLSRRVGLRQGAGS
jgi:decaprenylphospho-beta-D-ribofuranose 2-oxidase